MSATEIAREKILELEQQLAEREKQIVELRGYLEQLACLGNGTRHGNSVGNVLAIDALDAIDKDLSGYILCDAEPFWVSETVVENQLINGKPRRVWWECDSGVGTPLYKARTK